MDRVSRRPAVEEEPEGQGESGPDHRDEAVLRLQFSAGGFGEEDFVREDPEDDQSDEVSDSEAEVDQSCDPDGEVIVLAEHHWEGREEEVEIAVHDSHEE